MVSCGPKFPSQTVFRRYALATPAGKDDDRSRRKYLSI